jgi:hypothetical protein
MSFVGDLSKATRLNEVYEKQIAELEKRNRRDMFAAAVLTGMWAYPHPLGNHEEMAKKAAGQADAMIAALDAKQEGGATC